MKIELKKLSDIQPYDKNPRKNAKAVDTVADSIERYGFQQPIVVDTDGIIIVGHTRYQAAKKLAINEVPVVIAHNLEPDQVKAYRIMDNKSNEKAYWDQTLLIEELEDLLSDTTIQELSGDTGFSESELNRWFNTVEDTDDLLTIGSEKSTRAQTGDIWILGDHRVACGDSTDATLMAQLMLSDLVELIWEDPPYGISYETANNVNKSELEKAKWNQDNKIKNDDLTEEQLYELLNTHMSVIKNYLKPGAGIYWCHDIRFTQMFRDILTTYNIHISDTLIWKKNKHSNWMSNYVKYYEPILYGWDKGAQHRWYGDKWNPNTIELDTLEDMTKDQLIKIVEGIHRNYQEFDRLPAAQAAKMHPTVKPPKLIAYHIINSTKRGDIVYDGFAGSGSTLIAAEKTNRQARCIEFQPKYVDLIIQRWQEETGLQAVRSDGIKWDDIANTPRTDNQVMANLSEVLNLAE